MEKKQTNNERYIEKNIVAKYGAVSNITIREYDSIVKDMLQLIGTMIGKSFLGKIPLLSIITQEEWVNGLKLSHTPGLFTMTDFDEDVALTDFNPADNKNKEYLNKVTRKKVLRYAVRPHVFFTLGLNIPKLVDFLTLRTNMALKTVQTYMFKEKVRILTQLTIDSITPELTFDYDGTITGKVDTDANTKLLQREIRGKILELQTPGNHTAFSKTAGNESFEESYTPSDMYWIQNQNYYEAQGDLLATQFNADMLKVGITIEPMAFEPVIGKIESDKILGFLVHKDAIKLGTQVANLVWSYVVPGAKSITEIHNWFGFGRWISAPIYKIAVSTT